MKKQLYNQFASKNFKAYTLFLVLTFILWFAIQMTKSYDYRKALNINITDIPNHIVIDSANQTLRANIKANGIKLWTYNLSDKVISIPFNEFEKDTAKLKISAVELKEIIAQKFQTGTEQVVLTQKSIIYDYRQKQTKLVPVKPNISVTYSPGYNTLNKLVLKPDSIVVSGSTQYLAEIDNIVTQKISLENISDTVTGNVKLKQPSNNIELSQTDAEYFLPVEKFSENSLMVDIETINIPDSLDINIFPNKAKVSFLVSLKSFNKISGRDFKVICDYNKRYEDNAVIIPKLVEQPDNILNPKLHVKKVDYLIRLKP